MSRLVAAMEDEGLVRRGWNGADACSVVPHATGTGRRVLERARELRLSVLESLLSQAKPEELATVRAPAGIVDRHVL